MRRVIFVIFFIIFFPLSILMSQGDLNQKEDDLTISMTRRDGIPGDGYYPFDSSPDIIEKMTARYGLRLPKSLNHKGQVAVLWNAGPLFGIREELPEENSLKVILDVNMNFDLTDDKALIFNLFKAGKNSQVVKVKRSYPETGKKEQWLPYNLQTVVEYNKDGSRNVDLFFSWNYRFEGDFSFQNQTYHITMIENDLDGRFYVDKTYDFNLGIVPVNRGDTPITYNHGYDLINLGKGFYEISKIAEDGSWLELKKSTLPLARLGFPAPDLTFTDTQGNRLKISDFKGKVLLLDFWPCWCQPCISEFPNISKILEKYRKSSLAIIGINLDDKTRLNQALKVISDYGLTWSQIVEGKGMNHPAFKVFGRLPEYKMSFPIYVIIDQKGVVRYASNDFHKASRFLDAFFSGDIQKRDMAFVPLSTNYNEKESVIIPVNFALNKLVNVKLPAEVKLMEGEGFNARFGELPNGTLLLVRTVSAGKLNLILDSNRNNDLTDEKVIEIPILEKVPENFENMGKIGLKVRYKSGGMSFNDLCFFAVLPKSSGDKPDLYYRNFKWKFQGVWFDGKNEFLIEVVDPSADGIFTSEDIKSMDILRLKKKVGSDWQTVYKGTDAIPLNDKLYQLDFLSEDGHLVILVKKK